MNHAELTEPPSPQRQPHRLWGRSVTGRAGTFLFLAVTCLYLASMSREVAWGDARPIYEVAESIWGGKGIAVNTRWPSDAPVGRAGKYYAAQPWLTSLVHMPGAGLRQLISHFHPSPEIAHLLAVGACHLAGTLLGALTALLFFRLCLAHGASLQLARWTSLMLAFSSIIWVYARSPYSEIVQITCFTGFYLALTTHLRRPTLRHAFMVGLAASALINSKYIYVLSLPGAAFLMLWVLRKERRELLRQMIVVTLGLLPGLGMALLYNYLRFASPWSSGYQVIGQVMVENPFLGLWGFFFSPGKSLFLYIPPLVLTLLGLPAFLRSHRLSVYALLSTALPVLYFYAKFPSWPGDWAWGPRYAVFMVPALLLPSIAFLANVRWPGRTVALALVLFGFGVQLLGNAFYWDHFIRIAADVRTQWLGSPNRLGALTADKGGFCEGCFEDTYPTVWLPPLQPILGHYWMLQHVPFRHDVKRAMEDAPWKRHTQLPLNLQTVYKRARIDHFLCDLSNRPKTGGFLLFFFLSMGTITMVAFIRQTRPPISGKGGPDDSDLTAKRIS